MSEQWPHTTGESNQGFRTTEEVTGEVGKRGGPAGWTEDGAMEAGSGMRADG